MFDFQKKKQLNKTKQPLFTFNFSALKTIIDFSKALYIKYIQHVLKPGNA